VDSSSMSSAYLRHLLCPCQRGACDPANPDRASKHPYDCVSMNIGIGHLDVMIVFLVTEALST
jgi:hypothetical protein